MLFCQKDIHSPTNPTVCILKYLFCVSHKAMGLKNYKGGGCCGNTKFVTLCKRLPACEFFLERIWIPLENGSKALTFMQNAGCPCSHNAHWTFANWNNEQWHKKFWAERYWGSNVITRIVVIVMCSLDLFFWLGWMFYKCWICHTRNMKYAFFFKERKNQILDQIKKKQLTQNCGIVGIKYTPDCVLSVKDTLKYILQKENGSVQFVVLFGRDLDFVF